MIYLGFDLGDGESCVSWSRNALEKPILSAPVSGRASFLSAVGRLDGRLVVGYDAKHPEAEDVHVCFKRRFLEHRPEADQLLKDFVRGVLRELRKNPQIGELIDDPQEACFIVGCPAGWSREERIRYRDLLLSAGMKNVKVVSESRAAFENAVHDPANALDPTWFQKSVMVIDIGSSTLDFAYVYQGNEYDVSTMGNVLLGGGLMDEMIVLRAVDLTEKSQPETAAKIRDLLDRSDSQKSKLMLAAREIKEQYFTNEEFYLGSGESLSRTVRLFGGGEMLQLNLVLSPNIVENRLISRPHPLLDGQSFENRIRDSLIYAWQQAKERELPALLILTGGASRMDFFRRLCREQFPKAHVVCSPSPETDISRGLVYLGSIDEKMEAWIADVRNYAAGSAIRTIISDAFPDLAEKISDPLARLLVSQCVLPAFREWKSGKLKTLRDFESEARVRIERYMTSPAMQQNLGDIVTSWSRAIMHRVADDIQEISRRHRLDLRFSEDGRVRLSGGEGSGIHVPVTFLNVLGTVVSTVLVTVTGIICSSAGIAMIAEGVLGIVLGALIAIVAIALGSAAAREIILRMDLPQLLRKLIRTDSVTSEANLGRISRSIHESLLSDESIREDLTRQVSGMIDRTISEAVAGLESMIAC